jgi:CPA2 family monovalent cation:H+ antiporter-2
MKEVHALEPAIILLVVGILAIVLMRPLRLSPIVGYLLAGILIGPHSLGLIQESETTHLLAELGVVFLLFDIGLHFSLGHIWDARRDILGLGPLQVGLCTLAFGALAMAMGLEPSIAMVIGATLALSSTAVVVQTLAEYRQQTCPIGVSATAVLIFQDICAIFLLILAASLEARDTSLVAEIGLAALKAAAAFGAAILIGRYLIRPFFKLLSKSKNEEIFTAVGLLIVLVTATATGLLSLSLTLGAFLGGMIISETPYRHIIQTEIKPFRGLLLGFFFITVGMSLETQVLMREWGQILLLTMILLGVKTILVMASARWLKAPLRSALQLGFLLSQGSEFAFVILAMPALNSALGPDMSAILITAVAASLALTPSAAALGHALAKRIANKDLQAQRSAESGAAQQAAPVVIFGMDEVGRRVADALEAHGIAYTAMEMDHDRFVSAESDGYPVAFGDAGDLRLMETIQISQRPMIVITITRYEVSKALTPVVRERYPDLERLVSVETEEERKKFEALGMTAIVNRSIPRGLDVAAAVLRAHKLHEEKIQKWMRRQHDQALEALGPSTAAA